MDGNGRWARQRGKERLFGHVEGVESVRAVLEACVDWGVKYASFYAFSEENWNRPEEEVVSLMGLMCKAMRQELPTFMEHDVRFRVIGNRARLTPDMIEEIDEVESATAANGGLTMIVFLSYSGKWDILQAAIALAHDLIDEPGRRPGEEDFASRLSTAGIPDPDLLIRTSGEKRISNYLLWQTAYTEFVFTDTLWPDFRRAQLFEAFEEYALRDRRFGKIK